MANLPEIFTVNQFCLRLLSILAITSCKCVALIVIIFFISNQYSPLSSKLKRFVLFSVFAFFILAPLFVWISQFIALYIFQITRKNGDTYDSVRSFFLINSKDFSHVTLQNQHGYTTSYQSVDSFSSRLQWPFWVIMVWTFGTIISLLPVFYGLTNVMVLQKKTYTRKNVLLMSMLKEAMRELSVSKNIPIYISSKCKTPFASGILFTRIFVSEDIDSW